MPAQPLSPEQHEDAARLRAAWDAFKKANPGSSQERFAAECGWKTQGSFNQYLHGKIPLNLTALLKMARAMGNINPAEISPALAEQLAPHRATALPDNLASRLATADEATRKLVEIALYENDEKALEHLTPSLVAMVRGLKAVIAAQPK